MKSFVVALAVSAASLATASLAVAAPRHATMNEQNYQAVYQQQPVERARTVESQRTTGYIGPSAGSEFNDQADRTAITEGGN